MGARRGTAAPNAGRSMVAGAGATETTAERKICELTRVVGVRGRLPRPRSPAPRAPGRAAEIARDSPRSVRRTTAAASWYEVRGQPRGSGSLGYHAVLLGDSDLSTASITQFIYWFIHSAVHSANIPIPELNAGYKAGAGRNPCFSAQQFVLLGWSSLSRPIPAGCCSKGC